MSAFDDDKDRQVVPRWRSFGSSTKLGELNGLYAQPAATFKEHMLDDALADWRREPGLSVGADLVSAAMTVGFPHIAHDAARFVLAQDNAPPPARRIAQRCLDNASGLASPPFLANYCQFAFNEINFAIHQTRKRLKHFPWNAILWTDLALLFTTAGETQKAERAIRVALGLARNNRFVVRAACRLYLHTGDIEKAHAILLKVDGLKQDPWLLASEVAVASVRKRSSHHIRVARTLIDSQHFSPFHLSELGGALATIEAHDGALKRARQYCAFAMLEPAENAVAQTAWLSRRVDRTYFEPLVPRQPVSSEASAWIARCEGDWALSLQFARQWQNEQPFSSRPAVFASHTALTGLDEFSTAVTILRQGLLSNPDDAVLYNNLAFALAKDGQLEGARTALDQASELEKSDQTKICLLATKGLLAFRSGDVQQGRILYGLAIGSAVSPELSVLGDIARVYLALEEVRAGTLVAKQALDEASKAVGRLHPPYDATFRRKLENVTNSQM